jgi:hypothetical protein
MVNISVSSNFINDTGTTATIVKAIFDNVGGSWFTTLMLIMLFVILIAIVMRVPFELTAIFIIPLLLVSWIYVPDTISVLGCFLLYVGVLVGKNILFNR